MSHHYRIRTEKTGHYYTHGTITDQTKYIWICLHGYGQLAKYFIQKFEFLPAETHHVIVPEGLSRFYLEGLNDKPVASWMTREDRLDEIADYVIFLETLRHKIGWDRVSTAKVIYLGFSQGVATLIRWLANSQATADHLMLWAGSLPDDIHLEMYAHYFSTIPTSFFLGKHDPFINEQIADKVSTLMQRAGMQPAFHSFDGEHKVDSLVLSAWCDLNLENL